ncbi:MAG TPA: hypothetical protein VKB95_03785, partial [Chitinophagaceae bacterium]|nr:hypothetical protein [Chitinophagaceae bacterium]
MQQKASSKKAKKSPGRKALFNHSVRCEAQRCESLYSPWFIFFAFYLILSLKNNYAFMKAKALLLVSVFVTIFIFTSAYVFKKHKP